MPATDEDSYLQHARLALAEFEDWSRPLSGRWRTTGWWNAANILTAIIRFARLTGDDVYRELLPRIFFRRLPRRPRSFINKYYDDEGWWAAAWLEAYEWTGEARFLEKAELLFADMRGGWSGDCGGGIYWRKGSSYKAAIANSLYIYLAAWLQAVTGEDWYREEAERGWTWFTGSGLVGDDGLVRDGLNRACGIAGDIWTYNQGVFVGAAVRFHRGGIAPEGKDSGSMIEAAGITAYAAIDHLVHLSGILRENGEPDLDPDAVQFKGILMRHLADYWRETADERVASFIRANADSLWSNAREPGTNRVGASWGGPFDRADAGRQGSAFDALVAAATVSRPPEHGGA